MQQRLQAVPSLRELEVEETCHVVCPTRLSEHHITFCWLAHPIQPCCRTADVLAGQERVPHSLQGCTPRFHPQGGHD
jgi:hypothetical protein